MRFHLAAAFAAILSLPAAASDQPLVSAYIGGNSEIVRDDGQLAIWDVKSIAEGMYCVLIDRPATQFNTSFLPVIATAAGPRYDSLITVETSSVANCQKYVNDRRFAVRVTIVNGAGRKTDEDFSIYIPQH